MRQATHKSQTNIPEGDLAVNAKSFARHVRAKNLSPQTEKSYIEAVDQLADYLAKKRMPQNVADLTREHIESFIGDQLKKWRPATAANRYRSLQQFFKFLDEEGELPDGSPMTKMKPPRVPEQPPDVLREDELKKLMATCEGKDFESRRDAAIIRIFLDTGARVGEVAGIRLDYEDDANNDIDLDDGQLRLLGKGGRFRVVNLGVKSVTALDRYTKSRLKHPHARAPWLWLGQKGRMTTSGIRQVIRRRGRQAGFKKQLHPHQLRHSFAHTWLHAGGSEGDLMRLAGWRSRQMLERYGASAAQERALSAAKKLALGDRI